MANPGEESELYGSELVGQQLTFARDQVSGGPRIEHGIPARRRWPLLSFAGSLVCAIPWGIASGAVAVALGISGNDVLTFSAVLVPAIVISQVAGGRTRRMIGLGADGSLVIARAFFDFKTREPSLPIEAVLSPSTPIEIEESKPWWRARRIMIGNEAWFFNTQLRDFDSETFEGWVARRSARLAATA